MVDVLTVTKRTGWELAAATTLDAQSVKDINWIIVSEDPLATADALKDVKVMIVPPPEKIRISNLNRSLNAGLKMVTSEYVVFYQDFIDLEPDCIKKLLKEVTPRTFVTTATINADGTNDGRYIGADLPRPCRPDEWEANVAIAPMLVIKELGGFDCEYDNAWSWDNVNLAERAAMLGIKFIIDESNRPKLLFHEKETDMPINAQRHADTMEKIRRGQKPLKLNYL